MFWKARCSRSVRGKSLLDNHVVNAKVFFFFFCISAVVADLQSQHIWDVIPGSIPAISMHLFCNAAVMSL